MGRKFLVIAALSQLLWAQDLSQQGAQAMRAGRYADAERIYRELVKQDPNEAGWHGNLGLALHSQGKLAEATKAIERSLQLKPSPGLSVVLGLDYLKLNEPCRAVAPLERSDRLEALADALSGCKRYADAARLYVKLGDLRLAAHAYWQARDYSQAAPLYALLASGAGADPNFAFEYGDTLFRMEGAQAAIPWLQRSASLLEGRAALGKAYVEAGRFDDAIPHLEAAVKADPDLLLPLSRAYKATGRAAEAERALRDYRKRQSDQN